MAPPPHFEAHCELGGAAMSGGGFWCIPTEAVIDPDFDDDWSDCAFYQHEIDLRSHRDPSRCQPTSWD
jgi:hypothetical protein